MLLSGAGSKLDRLNTAVITLPFVSNLIYYCRHPVAGSEVPPSTCLYIEHFNSCLLHCRNIETTLQQFYGELLTLDNVDMIL